MRHFAAITDAELRAFDVFVDAEDFAVLHHANRYGFVVVLSIAACGGVFAHLEVAVDLKNVRKVRVAEARRYVLRAAKAAASTATRKTG